VKKIAASGQTRLSIRVPVIPTFNATSEEIRAIARFADALPGVEEIYLLPYHRLGQDKYAGLGRVYELPDILPPNVPSVSKTLRILRNCRFSFVFSFLSL
jgi:pyruvate formate lyase activating enzyme